MSEPVDKKRTWWSRFVGADGSRPNPEELVQQLAEELSETREFADRLAAERDAALAALAKRTRDDAGALARARGEIDQLRRAADSQIAGLRAQLEVVRKEHAEERLHREQVQRDAHARERELGGVIASQQREVAAARAVALRAEEEVRRAKKAMIALQAQCDESRRATADVRDELQSFRRVALTALGIVVGDQGRELALHVAASAASADRDAP